MNNRKTVMVILSVVLGIAAVITLVMSLSKDRATDKSKEIIARINHDTAVVNNQENDSLEAMQVAITFDDGPSTVYTEILLDGLKERGVKATFFLTGQEIQYSKKVVKRMSTEGHLIGNHTYTHIDLKRTGFSKAKQEIEKTNECIKAITGKSPKYIRPPYGDWDKRLLEETDMSIVLWSVDPEDWKDQNANIVAKRIIKNTKPGDVILLHDIFKTSVDAALIVIDELQSKGYRFVTVDKMNNSKIISNNTYQKEN